MTKNDRLKLNSTFITQSHQEFSEDKVLLYNQWASDSVVRMLLVLQQKEDENHMANEIITNDTERAAIPDDLVRERLTNLNLCSSCNRCFQMPCVIYNMPNITSLSKLWKSSHTSDDWPLDKDI